MVELGHFVQGRQDLNLSSSTVALGLQQTALLLAFPLLDRSLLQDSSNQKSFHSHWLGTLLGVLAAGSC